MVYQELKNKFLENKQKIIIGTCFVLVFLLGYGTGKINSPDSKTLQVKSVNNYTTKARQNPPAANPQAQTTPPPAPTASATPSTLANCAVKGNISSNGKKIYHLPGGAFYNIVKPEQCFNNEGEALAAGFIKSSR